MTQDSPSMEIPSGPELTLFITDLYKFFSSELIINMVAHITLGNRNKFLKALIVRTVLP